MNLVRWSGWERRSKSPGVRPRGVATVASWLALLGVVSGCALARPPSAPPAAAPDLTGPAIREGLRDEEEARAAAQLLTEGEAHFAQGRYSEARELARTVEATLPEAVGSAFALWLRGRASRELEDWADADAALTSYLSVVPPSDPYHAQAVLLRAEVRWDGDLGGALEALFELPTESEEAVLISAEEVASSWARELDSAALRDLAQEAPRHPRILPPFLVELGVRRALQGDDAEGRELAEQALALAPGAEVASRARSILEGRVADDLAVAATLGAILAGSGSPSVLQVSQDIRDGVEVALLVEERSSILPIRFLSAEDGGDPTRVVQAMESFERQGVSGVVGPLLDPLVDAAFRSRSGSIPILSPTARMLPDGAAGVFSLTAVDPEAGRSLARLVLNTGIRQVVVLHPTTSEMAEEARWFREAFESGGGTIVRTFTYPIGSTSFGAPFGEIVRLAPRGLVLLLTPGEVEVVAPQLAFYGVDQVDGITLFGNESWVSQPVLQGVLPRHTDGVLSVSPRSPGSELGPGWDAFVVAYEEHFRRTLRSPVPALGYDAARLLVRAALEGGGTPEGTRRALDEIRNFPGATGILSVVDGRVVRTYSPVRIENRQLIPLVQ